jgi:hypothetical protein
MMQAKRLAIWFTTLGAVLLLMWSASANLAGVAEGAIAAVPTSTRPPTPEAPATDGSGGKDSLSLPAGGTITLHARFSAQWPWYEWPWQDVWTRVEWQDNDGEWHAVTGWRGALDSIATDGERYVGEKSWWVYQSHLGRGPFRWAVYTHEGGDLIARSEAFQLPDEVGEDITSEVALAP